LPSTEEAPAGVWDIALGGSVEKLERIQKKATYLREFLKL